MSEGVDSSRDLSVSGSGENGSSGSVGARGNSSGEEHMPSIWTRLRWAAMAIGIGGGIWGTFAWLRKQSLSLLRTHPRGGTVLVVAACGGSVLLLVLLRFVTVKLLSSFENRQRFSRSNNSRRSNSRSSSERQAYVRASIRLMTLNRDFTDADYEALLELDNHSQDLTQFLEGAPQSVIDCLPSYPFKENPTKDSAGRSSSIESLMERCSICLEEYNHGEILRILPCFHQYHKDCIDVALSNRASCPICKLSIQDEIQSTYNALSALS